MCSPRESATADPGLNRITVAKKAADTRTFIVIFQSFVSMKGIVPYRPFIVNRRNDNNFGDAYSRLYLHFAGVRPHDADQI